MSEATSRQALHSVAMSSPSPNTALQDKTDDEIQAEILSIKKKFYDRMDLQVEKDLILEERERLDEEKRKLDIQKEFLRQKMSRVYEDEFIKKDKELSNQKAIKPEEEFNEYYDVFKNGRRSAVRSASERGGEEEVEEVVPQRRNKWHPEVGKVSGPDLNNVRSNIDNKRPRSKRNQSGIFHDPFADKNIPQVNHYNSVLERSFYLPKLEDDNFQRKKSSKEISIGSRSDTDQNTSYQPTSRLHKTYYNL